jgi:ATP-binding cassette subfamily B protein
MPPASLRQKVANALRIDRSLALVLKAGRGWTLVSAGLTVAQGLIPVAALYVIKLIVDTVSLAVSSGDATGTVRRIVLLVAAAAAVAIVQAALRLAAGYVAEAQSAVVTDYVSSALHEKSISLDLAYYENPQYYDTLHRAQREGPYRPTRIVNGLTGILQNGMSLLAMVGLLFMLHWSMGILLVASTVPGVVVQVLHARKRYEWQKRRTQDERRASYLSHVLTSEQFAKEIRLFDLGGFFASSFDSLRTMLRAEKLGLTRSRSLADFAAQAAAALVLTGCLLYITLRALHGSITVGDMVMYYQAFQRGIGFLKDLLAGIAALYEDNLFVAHFFEFLDIESAIVDPAEPIAAPAQFTRGISFDHVSFGYPGTRNQVLQDVSLTIGAGEVVALVGANGAGKSTIVKLLCRLYDPQQGTIAIDGHGLRSFAVKDLRRRISVVFQDFARYYLTARENIRLGDTDIPADSPKIREAAVKANADGFIDRLPQGYDTVLGRWFYSGEELSIGEWQKIVLARAFLRNSPLIILDEPTSSLDTLTEYHLFMKFRELIAGNSALLISHRFSTVRMADRIYVLDEGRIAEEGSHERLMQLGGIYADMYSKQAAWLRDEPREST